MTTPAEACRAAYTLLKEKRGAEVAELSDVLTEVIALLEDGLTATTATPEVMTVEDLADYLQVGSKLVYKMAKSGELPSARLGDQWRFKRSLIDRWLEDQAVRKNGNL